MLLDKNALLNMPAPKIERIDCPDDGHIFIRALPMADLDEYEAENYIVDSNSGKVSYNRRNIRARLLVRAICDDKGNPVFTMKDVDAVSKRTGKFWDDCYRAALRLNGMTGKEDVEMAEKNSESAPDENFALPWRGSSE